MSESQSKYMKVWKEIYLNLVIYKTDEKKRSSLSKKREKNINILTIQTYVYY